MHFKEGILIAFLFKNHHIDGPMNTISFHEWYNAAERK